MEARSAQPMGGPCTRVGRRLRRPGPRCGQFNLRTVRLHDLPHTHATLALKAGVPVKVISERLGHESPAFTLKQHAHVIPCMQAEAAAQVADLVDWCPPNV